jgi:3-methyladenine DNA glycosylase AlkD
MAESRRLIAAVRRELRERADPAKAAPMQAYMKSAMPYRGVQTPALRAVCREVFAAFPLAGFENWRDTALALWRRARFREERYAAVELLHARQYRALRTLRALPIYEEIVVTGAWWDYVDYVAGHLLGELLREHPAEMKRRMRAWSRSRDLWKRRAAILSQLKRKGETDLDLLYDCIERAIDSREFFLRKSIGWALREYAKTDPAEVKRYVARQGERLSPLSRREALKNLGG